MSVQSADIFISHANEDKDDIARPLAEALRRRGFVVWYDEYVLRLGDSLRQVIDKGLSSSRFGVVILSPSFFSKEWPQRELNGLLARETANGSKVLLPVWHRITFEEVVQFSPLLADKFAVSTTRGLDVVVQQILDVLELERPVPQPELESFPVSTLSSEFTLPKEDKTLSLSGTQAVSDQWKIMRRAVGITTAVMLVGSGGIYLWSPWTKQSPKDKPSESAPQLTTANNNEGSTEPAESTTINKDQESMRVSKAPGKLPPSPASPKEPNLRQQAAKQSVEVPEAVDVGERTAVDIRDQPVAQTPGAGASLGTVPDYEGDGRVGVLLAGVRSGSPAEKGGLRRGDLLVELAGSAIRDTHDLVLVLTARGESRLLAETFVEAAK